MQEKDFFDPKNKSELLEFKKRYNRDLYLVAPNGRVFSLGAYDGPDEYIYDEKEAVEDVEEIFENTISYCCRNDMEFDEITFIPTFSIYVKESDFDSNGDLKPDAKPLRKVKMDLKSYRCKNGEEELGEGDFWDVIGPYYFFQTICYHGRHVDFYKFKRKLAREGFKLEGINRVEDIRDKIIAGELAEGKITISFKEKKETNQIEENEYSQEKQNNKKVNEHELLHFFENNNMFEEAEGVRELISMQEELEKKFQLLEYYAELKSEEINDNKKILKK